jgi:hypothetical protein
MAPNPVGIPNLTKEDYGQLLTLLGESCNNLSQAYASRQKTLDVEFQRLRDAGVPVYKVQAQVKDFLSWCNENGREVNRDAWDSFIAHKAGLLHAQVYSGK